MSPARRRRRPRALNPRMVSIVVIAAIFAISYKAFHPALPFSHPYQLHALFANSNQLRSGSPVRIAGVEVGKVTGVSEGPGQTASVTMNIGSSGQPIHRDAIVAVRPRLFLEGGFYVDIHPGSPSLPTLSSGATIPLPQTSYPVQFDRVLSTFSLPTRTDLRTVVKQLGTALSGGGAQGLRATPASLTPVLRDLAWISESARGSATNDLSSAIGYTSRVTGALGDRAAQLADLVSSLDTTAAALASQDGALGASVQQLDRTLIAAPPALSALDRVLPTLASFSSALDPGLKAAPVALGTLSGEVAELAALVAPAERRRLVIALRAAFTQLPTLVNRLGSLFPVAGPLTKCVVTHAVPLLSSVVPDGSLSTGRPAWEDFVHALVGLASQGQNFDANGYTMRYLAGLGTATLSTGSLPVIGQLVGTGSSAPLQSRPVWLGAGSTPPLRPDLPCSTQPLPNLNVPAGPAGLAASSARSAPTATSTPRLTIQQLLATLAPTNLRHALRSSRR
ncbi:MAG: MlaD family protein [Solirubrobacteraceae bacterium]|nr:MAG: hypothetical protein DLM63_07460 [Solirubrobacterales bacterium]